MTPLPDLFWSKVDTSGECWIWTGATDRWGYGRFGRRSGGGKPRFFAAHRASWEAANGRSAGESHVLHRCDTPSCVNPAHLFLGDNLANVHDCIAKGRDHRGSHPNALTGDLADAIHAAVLAGELSYREIGARFGVRWQAIKALMRRRRRSVV